MIKLSELSNLFFAKKIASPAHLADVLQAKHNPVRIFGINFSPKYKLSQDVFDNANLKELTVPQGLFLKFNGYGNPLTKLKILADAVFKAPFATFGDTETAAKKTVIREVHNLKTTAGKTNIPYVKGDNFASGGIQEIEFVEGNNVGSGNACQSITCIKKNNISNGVSRQYLGYVGGNTDGYEVSNQYASVVAGNVNLHGKDSEVVVMDRLLSQHPLEKMYNY